MPSSFNAIIPNGPNGPISIHVIVTILANAIMCMIWHDADFGDADADANDNGDDNQEVNDE